MSPIKLRIDAPCTESWDDMSPLLNGRHCTSCQKIVQDFTQFSEAQLVAWFAQHTGPTCGRLRDDQVNLPLYDNAPNRRTGLGGWVRWALAFVLGWQSARAHVLKADSARPIILQPLIPLVGKTEIKHYNETNREALFYVHGQAVYPDGKPARLIIIEKIERGTFVRSDTTGHFAVPIYEADQRRDSLTLWFDYAQKITVSTKQEQPAMRLTLPTKVPIRTVVVGDISVIRQPDPPKRKGDLFKRSDKR